MLPPSRYKTFISDTPTRQPGQGSEEEVQKRDLRAELLAAEAAHFAKTKGAKEETTTTEKVSAPKRQLEGGPQDGGGPDEEEDPEAKRRRILEETREIDADSIASDSDSSEEDRLVPIPDSRGQTKLMNSAMTKRMKLRSSCGNWKK